MQNFCKYPPYDPAFFSDSSELAGCFSQARPPSFAFAFAFAMAFAFAFASVGQRMLDANGQECPVLRQLDWISLIAKPASNPLSMIPLQFDLPHLQRSTGATIILERL